MKIGNKEFDLKNHAYVMGILNVTPDSFSDGGKWNDKGRAMRHTQEMIEQGATIIDIGGESARPGYTRISDEEEIISTPKKDKEEPVIRRGRIEFFNESKGFGFIKDLSGVEKYFFHINNVLTDIAENNIVTFDLERGLKGMNAVNVALEVEKAKEKKENKETLNTES